MSHNSFIKTEDHLTVAFDDGTTQTMYSSDPHYQDLIKAINAKQWEQAKELMCPSLVVKKQMAKLPNSDGRVTVEAGIVKLDGQLIHNTLTKRMVQMAEEGFDITPMSNFLANLFDNPSYRAVNELYGFMENSDLPITDDGHFIAYKRVRQNYTDCHSGNMDNSVGTVVKMARNQVNEDAKQTCSAGLHFCSRSYLTSFGNEKGNRTVVVKINPRDVVSIPVDYNNAKGRCCEYEVLYELEHGKERKLEETVVEVTKPVEKLVEPEQPAKTPLAPVPKVAPTQTGRNIPTDAILQVDPKTDIIIKEWDNAKQAAEYFGGTASGIRRVCRGERKTAYGYKWFFDNGAAPYGKTETVAVPEPAKPSGPSGIIMKRVATGIIVQKAATIDSMADLWMETLISDRTVHEGVFYRRLFNRHIQRVRASDEIILADFDSVTAAATAAGLNLLIEKSITGGYPVDGFTFMNLFDVQPSVPSLAGTPKQSFIDALESQGILDDDSEDDDLSYNPLS